jgi:hypothetical protein
MPHVTAHRLLGAVACGKLIACLTRLRDSAWCGISERCSVYCSCRRLHGAYGRAIVHALRQRTPLAFRNMLVVPRQLTLPLGRCHKPCSSNPVAITCTGMQSCALHSESRQEDCSFNEWWWHRNCPDQLVLARPPVLAWAIKCVLHLLTVFARYIACDSA